MRRLLVALAALAALSACTPRETAAWLEWHRLDPVAAEAHARTLTPTVSYRTGGKCSQWHDAAINAGFTERQWPNVAYIMYRESRCQPEVQNPSGATGLMQIMPMWADDCGGTRSMLFDGWFNLRCAVHILHTQGWSAWAL